MPRVLDDLQQLVTPDTLLLALQFAREAGEPRLGLVGQGCLFARRTSPHAGSCTTQPT